MLSIFEYSQPHEFLRDRWREKKEKNPSFSLRAWAQHLGMESHAPLHLMVAGKRTIPRKYLPLIISSLGLSPREGLYLETLVELSRAKDTQEQEYYAERLKELSPNESFRIVELESFRYLGDPIHTVILEMTDLPDFRNDPQWIQSRLSFPADARRIRDAVDRLISLGLVRETGEDRLQKTNHHVSNRKDVADKAVQQYHNAVSRLAAESISSQPVQEREYNGYSFNVQTKDIPRAKKLLREFVESFMQQIEAPPGTGEQTYQLNLQFFALTRFSEKPAFQPQIKKEISK